MDPFLLKLYLREIELQCNYTLQTVQEINQAMQQKDTQEVFRKIHYLLINAGNISKLLWPSGQKTKTKRERAKKRGETLLKVLKIRNSHPLNNRVLRNHLEHYDTRLDDWANNSPNLNYVDMNISAKGEIKLPVTQDAEIMRHFDPETCNFSFRDEEINIQAITTGIKQILTKVKALST